MARWQSANYTRYHQLLRVLDQMGHKVVVLQSPALSSAEISYQEVECSSPGGIIVESIPLAEWFWKHPLPLDKLIKKASYTLVSLRYLQDIIDGHDIDTLLLYNLPQYFLAMRSRCLTVFDMPDDLVASFSNELGRAVFPGATRVAKLVLNGMIRESDLTLVASRTLQKTIAIPAPILPNGANLAEIARVAPAPLPLKRPGPVVGYLGCFEYFVDMDMVLAAAALLPDVSFWLAGSGRDFCRIENRARAEGLDNVYFPGPVSHETGLAMMAAADVCLLPRRLGPVSDAACPIKLFEYAALGKPIIATPAEEVKLIAGGFASFVTDASEMAATIRTVLSNPLETKSMVENGMEKVQTIYNWHSIAKTFECVVEERRRAGASRGIGYIH